MRVFKQFLKNMIWPVGLSMGYVVTAFVSGFVGEMLGFSYWVSFLAGPFTLTLFSFTGFLVWIEWDRARETVKQENDDILGALKDE